VRSEQADTRMAKAQELFRLASIVEAERVKRATLQAKSASA